MVVNEPRGPFCVCKYNVSQPNGNHREVKTWSGLTRAEHESAGDQGRQAVWTMDGPGPDDRYGADIGGDANLSCKLRSYDL